MDARIIADQVEDGRPGMTSVLASLSQTRLRDLALGFARVQLETSHARKSEGAGNAGCAVHPQARVRCRLAESTRGNHGHTGITRHSPRNGFTAYIVSTPAIGLSCHRRQRIKGSSSPVGPTLPPPT